MGRMSRLAILLGTAGILLVGSPLAQAHDFDPNSIEAEVLTNVSHEMVICAAYFAIVSEGVRRTGDDKLADHYKAAFDQLMEASAGLSNPEVALARLQMAMEDHSEQMKGDYSNISILLAEYGRPCKEVTENVEGRIDYWWDRVEQRRAVAASSE